MLAYLFAHQPAPGVDVAEYEDVLREFHAHLAASRIEGFVSSCTYRIAGAGKADSGYTDWYVVEDSGVLDRLNEAAVTGARATPHRAAARMATNGAGKLVSLVDGTFEPSAMVETRFAKPEGMSYPDLYAMLRPVSGAAGAALWRRMMVLGPPPEFLLTSPAAVDLPAAIRGEVLERSRI